MKSNLPFGSYRYTVNLGLMNTLMDTSLKGKPKFVSRSVRLALQPVPTISATHFDLVQARIMAFEWGLVMKGMKPRSKTSRQPWPCKFKYHMLVNMNTLFDHMIFSYRYIPQRSFVSYQSSGPTEEGYDWHVAGPLIHEIQVLES